MQLRLRKLHAVIRDENFTSAPTLIYNCVGYAIGDPRWWGTAGSDSEVWLEGIGPKDSSIECYVRLFQNFGFALCDDEGPNAVPGYEKLAVFGTDGEFEHVAIQTVDGTWISKLGDFEDISHPLAPMENQFYGSICHYLKRKGEINRQDHFPLKATF